MFSSRSIHFALLGIILGASAGYVFAFYRASAALPPPLTEAQAEAEVPAGHPEVNSQQMLDAMKKAVELDPNQPEVIKRYATALFEAGQINEASKWFGKAVELEPNSVENHSMYGAALWRLGDKDGATSQLEATLKIDPNNIPGLHGLTLIAIEKKDFTRADQFIKRIEAIQPAYDQLTGLRSRLEAARAQ